MTLFTVISACSKKENELEVQDYGAFTYDKSSYDRIYDDFHKMLEWQKTKIKGMDIEQIFGNDPISAVSPLEFSSLVEKDRKLTSSEERLIAKVHYLQSTESRYDLGELSLAMIEMSDLSERGKEEVSNFIRAFYNRQSVGHFLNYLQSLKGEFPNLFKELPSKDFLLLQNLTAIMENVSNDEMSRIFSRSSKCVIDGERVLEAAIFGFIGGSFLGAGLSAIASIGIQGLKCELKKSWREEEVSSTKKTTLVISQDVKVLAMTFRDVLITQ